MLRGPRCGGTLQGVKGEALETMRARNSMGLVELCLDSDDTEECQSCHHDITSEDEAVTDGDGWACFHAECVEADMMDAAVDRFLDPVTM